MALKLLPQGERYLQGSLSALLSAAATEMTVDNPPSASKLPTYIELEPASDQAETVKATAVAGNVVTIVRGVYSGGVGVEHLANTPYKQKFSQKHWDAAVDALETGYLTLDDTIVITRDSNTQFTISDQDYTTVFTSGRAIKANTTVLYVASSALSSGDTVVTLRAGSVLPTPITSISVAIQPNGVDYATLTGTETLTNKTLTSPKLNEDVAVTATATEVNLLDGVTSLGFDGWIPATDTWTYASATTFTIAGVDRTALFPKGTKIKLTQTTDKYFYVIGSAFSTDTTITVTGGTNYTLSNAAITSPNYSYMEIPQGFPTWFGYAPTITAPTGTPPTYTAVDVGKFKVNGHSVTMQFAKTNTSGGTAGSGGVNIYFSLPVTANVTATLAETVHGGMGQVYDTAGPKEFLHLLVYSNTLGAFRRSTTALLLASDQSSTVRFLYGELTYQI